KNAPFASKTPWSKTAVKTAGKDINVPNANGIAHRMKDRITGFYCTNISITNKPVPIWHNTITAASKPSAVASDRLR
ncbi:hypothetical protein L4G92_09375, partial [Neisseria sp. ZJ106]|uniref:hypothetical protein n=1 Tax=Neisseria lisongii TaxID=2912188 RepID=UPI001F196253